MAVKVLQNVNAYFRDVDATAQFQQVTLEIGREELDGSTVGDDTRTRVSGFMTGRGSQRGFVDLTDDGIDEKFFDAVGDNTSGTAPSTGTAVPASPFSVIPDTSDISNAVGDLAYLMGSTASSYRTGDEIGVLLPFDLTTVARKSPVVRGVLASRVRDETTTQAYAGVQLGALAAGESLYAALHVIDVDSISDLRVDVDSDDAVGFASPTVRVTWPSMTTRTHGFARVDGPVTDDWWRAQIVTLTGTSAKVVVTFGIAPTKGA